MEYNKAQCSFCNGRDKCKFKKTMENVGEEIAEIIRKNEKILDKADFRYSLSCYSYNYHRNTSAYESGSEGTFW